MPSNSLSAQGLVCYRGDQCLFNNLNFQLDSEQLLLIEGRNGSGKTSLLKLIAGLRYPDEGELQWNGRSLKSLATEYAQLIAYVGHQDGVKRELTVEENLRLWRQLLPQQDVAIDDMLDQLKLSVQRDSLAATLSAGQRRRIALARAIYSQASLWILDEPFTSLDKANSEFLVQAIQHHLEHSGMIVMTSHHELDLSAMNVQTLVIQ